MMNSESEPKYITVDFNHLGKKYRNGGTMIINREWLNLMRSQNNDPTSVAADRRFKNLPSEECLPKSEVLGGYIFVCNDKTMPDHLKSQLFGLPSRYRNSVRTITPGLPLFLYNYTTRQLHGVFESTTFGGSNIDPTFWKDHSYEAESTYPAQVRIRVRKLYKPLEEEAFCPILDHYMSHRFRLELTIPQTLALLDLYEEAGSP